MTDTAAVAEQTAPLTLTAETASEYDFIIALDASGSMANESRRFEGKTRWQEMHELAFGIASAVSQYDADGIDVVPFGAGAPQLIEGVNPQKLNEIFSQRSPGGSTPLDKALTEIVAKQARTGKNTVAIVFTDGAPDSQPAVEKVIVDAANGAEKDEALTFLFVQIGDDAGATKFLQHLDDDLQGKGAKFDIVDTLKSEEAETMSPLQLINHAIND